MIQGLRHASEHTSRSATHDGEEFGQRVDIAATREATGLARCTVAIIGAGFGGIGMAIRLKRAGWHDFVIIEQADTVGGVWRDNTYPDCACDIPSHLYSLSFAPSADWSRRYPTQAEIRRYLEECVERFGLTPHLRTGVSLKEAKFENAAALWLLRTDPGPDLAARFLVLATGALHRPAFPALRGIESFRGVAFHSARWKHGTGIKGKHVAVIGTGASAAQFVPRIAEDAARLVLFSTDAAVGIAEIGSSLQPAHSLGSTPCSLASAVVACVVLLDPRDARIWFRAVSQSYGRTRKARSQPCEAAGSQRCVTTSAHARRSHGLQAGAALQ